MLYMRNGAFHQVFDQEVFNAGERSEGSLHDLDASSGISMLLEFSLLQDLSNRVIHTYQKQKLQSIKFHFLTTMTKLLNYD